MPTIPTHHNIGDTGHIVDHNSIVDVLGDHESRITGLQSGVSGYLVNTGQNTVTVTNPTGYAEHVVIPSGTRDGTVFVQAVTYGGKQTFGLDTFGQLRVGSCADGNVPAEFSGNSATQSADLTRWRVAPSSTIVARIGSDGTVYAPNITPGSWTNVTLSSGLVSAAGPSGTGAVPSYRLTGDRMDLRGSIKKTDGSAMTSSPLTLGTIPSTLSPLSIAYFICATNIIADISWARVHITPTGTIQAYFSTGAGFTPNWINLDGISFIIRS